MLKSSSLLDTYVYTEDIAYCCNGPFILSRVTQEKKSHPLKNKRGHIEAFMTSFSSVQRHSSDLQLRIFMKSVWKRKNSLCGAAKIRGVRILCSEVMFASILGKRMRWCQNRIKRTFQSCRNGHATSTCPPPGRSRPARPLTRPASLASTPAFALRQTRSMSATW